jgi:glycine cleavage system regulatory protein
MLSTLEPTGTGITCDRCIGDCRACLLSWSRETTIESIQPKILTYSGKQTKDKFFDNDVRARLPSLQEIQKLSDRLNKKTAP